MRVPRNQTVYLGRGNHDASFEGTQPGVGISLIALFVALGGTSLAATKVISAKHKDAKADTKLIKKLAPKLNVKHAKTASSATTAASAATAAHATSADSATKATHATSADSATNATHATTADAAANASAVGGLAASQLQKRVTGTCASGSAIQSVGGDGSVACQTVGTTVLWAVANSDATIARGSGTTGSVHLGAGQYEVDFDRDVTNCAYTATIGPAAGGSAVGDISVAPRAGNADAVFVYTHNSDGSATADLPFHLMVAC